MLVGGKHRLLGGIISHEALGGFPADFLKAIAEQRRHLMAQGLISRHLSFVGWLHNVSRPMAKSAYCLIISHFRVRRQPGSLEGIGAHAGQDALHLFGRGDARSHHLFG